LIASSIETMNGKEVEMKAELIGESVNISISSEMVRGGDEVTSGADDVQEVPGLESTLADLVDERMTSTAEERRVSNARTLKMIFSRTADE